MWGLRACFSYDYRKDEEVTKTGGDEDCDFGHLRPAGTSGRLVVRLLGNRRNGKKARGTVFLGAGQTERGFTEGDFLSFVDKTERNPWAKTMGGRKELG